jgi:hypothetical protein
VNGSDDQADDDDPQPSMSGVPHQLRTRVQALHQAYQHWQSGSLPHSVSTQLLAAATSAEGSKVLRAVAGLGGGEDNKEALMARLSSVLVSEAQSVVAGWAEAVRCPQPHVPVSDWPLCMTPAGLYGQHLVAGTAGGQLLFMSMAGAP